ncbi:acyl-CoA dehydrogenase family protein [Halorarum salinum]|uniref:Acyl-CoA dehydrogenase family protein n=1 Tax=Halorarum salinum TaxID=2743089 RepID=A0A7D5LC82_9EURY|nr:acyl-CoA dehydrogenase family protein [Halobaculum salinum]QLG62987.1 acyl-CoA dehydrogenase family protein [Halobaculum salinum]
MRFEPTDEQRAVREEARGLVREELEPEAARLDGEGAYPGEFLAELGDRGLAGLLLPEEYGGRGGGLVELALVTEELSAGLMSAAAAFGLHVGVAAVVERFGKDDLKRDVLPGMARMGTVGALGLSEDEAGSDKSTLATTARREGDEWVLDGHKRWVTNFEEADVVLTYARTGPADGSGNATAFLLPAGDLELDRRWDTLGARSVSTCRVTLEGVRVPDDRRVGSVDGALAERGRVRTGVNVPARAVGLARAALEDAAAYAEEREQFGRAIGEFQGIRWRVADMTERVEAARLLTLRAADLADRARDDAGRGDADPGRALRLAKVNATEAAVENANEALQTLGGVGYTRDRAVERYLRDARLLTIAGGPNEVHRDAVADAAFERGR